MSFELLGTKTLVCMDINKWKNAFSEKFGLFYLPGSAPENLTGPLKSGFSSCSDYPVDGILKLCHEKYVLGVLKLYNYNYYIRKDNTTFQASKELEY